MYLKELFFNNMMQLSRILKLNNNMIITKNSQ